MVARSGKSTVNMEQADDQYQTRTHYNGWRQSVLDVSITIVQKQITVILNDGMEGEYLDDHTLTFYVVCIAQTPQ